ncbi:MAG: hypothetical protein Q9187_008449 [Circinaria calcarea]
MGTSPPIDLNIAVFPQSSRIAIFYPSQSTHIRSQSLGKLFNASLQSKVHNNSSMDMAPTLKKSSKLSSKKHRPCDAPQALQDVVVRHSERRRARKPKLTSQNCEAEIQKRNSSGPLALRDADQHQWHVSEVETTAIRACDIGSAMMFLRYVCENYKVRAFSSAHQYLLQFQQLYNRVNGQHMDTNDAKEAFKVQWQTLVTTYTHPITN